MLELSVTDTGSGIPPEDLERIFSSFAQLDGGPGRACGGVGLGLAVVRALVERLGGRVWAESDGPDRGARFVLRVPGQEFDRRLRVLVVEDEPTLLKTVTVFLRDVGYEVVGAGTAGTALGAIAAGPPDLVVLDLGLPDQPGEVVLKAIRASEPLRAVPVLVMTGMGEAQADVAMAAGADEFLTKPFSLTVLMRVVAELLQGRAHRAPDDVPAAAEGETP